MEHDRKNNNMMAQQSMGRNEIANSLWLHHTYEYTYWHCWHGKERRENIKQFSIFKFKSLYLVLMLNYNALMWILFHIFQLFISNLSLFFCRRSSHDNKVMCNLLKQLPMTFRFYSDHSSIILHKWATTMSFGQGHIGWNVSRWVADRQTVERWRWNFVEFRLM